MNYYVLCEIKTYGQTTTCQTVYRGDATYRKTRWCRRSRHSYCVARELGARVRCGGKETTIKSRKR
jgi:hypothetical protein